MPRPVILYIALTLAGTALLLPACSGASAQDVLAGSSGAASSSSSSGTSGTASSSGTGSSSSSSGTSGTTSSSGSNPSCTREEESNDTKSDANSLAPKRCGTLSKRDRIDYLTFRLQPTTKTMSIDFTGRVRLTIDVAGQQTAVLTPDNAGMVPFVLDEDYFIAVTPNHDSDVDGSSEIQWSVTLNEN